MRGHDTIIATLNKLLAEELTAINQYMVHSEMCDAWGYARLHKAIEKTAIDEMKHAEKLIGRILFLEGLPTVSTLNPMHIGKDVKAMIVADMEGEAEAIKAYNAGIKQAMELGDAGTAELLKGILKDEEVHLDWREAQRDQMDQAGLSAYLMMQVRE
jgi:bacterioferritin